MNSLMYIGPQSDLKNNRALVQLSGVTGIVKVQFTTCPHHPWRCIGWHDFQASDFFGHYTILAGGNPGWYRVMNLKTLEESSLYTYNECIKIVMNGLAGELLGSFDISKEEA